MYLHKRSNDTNKQYQTIVMILQKIYFKTTLIITIILKRCLTIINNTPKKASQSLRSSQVISFNYVCLGIWRIKSEQTNIYQSYEITAFDVLRKENQRLHNSNNNHEMRNGTHLNRLNND